MSAVVARMQSFNLKIKYMPSCNVVLDMLHKVTEQVAETNGERSENAFFVKIFLFGVDLSLLKDPELRGIVKWFEKNDGSNKLVGYAAVYFTTHCRLA